MKRCPGNIYLLEARTCAEMYPGREGSGQKRPNEVMGTGDAKAGRGDRAQDVCTAAGGAWSEHRPPRKGDRKCLWGQPEATSALALTTEATEPCKDAEQVGDMTKSPC